jgi:hypothetical protein
MPVATIATVKTSRRVADLNLFTVGTPQYDVGSGAREPSRRLAKLAADELIDLKLNGIELV